MFYKYLRGKIFEVSRSLQILLSQIIQVPPHRNMSLFTGAQSYWNRNFSKLSKDSMNTIVLGWPYTCGDRNEQAYIFSFLSSKPFVQQCLTFFEYCSKSICHNNNYIAHRIFVENSSERSNDPTDLSTFLMVSLHQ